MVVKLPDEPVKQEHRPPHQDTFTRALYKKMIFLPFNSMWQMTVRSAVFGMVMLITYRVYFTKSFNTVDNVLFYLFQSVFAIDTICAYMHRYMKNLNKYAVHTPRNIFLLTIDMLSLFPLFELYYLVNAEEALKIAPYIRLKNLFRIHSANKVETFKGIITVYNRVSKAASQRFIVTILKVTLNVIRLTAALNYVKYALKQLFTLNKFHMKLIEHIIVKFTIHIFYYMWSQKNHSDKHNAVVIIILHIVYTTLFGLLLAVLWYNLGCWEDCKERNWTDALKYFDVDVKDITSRYIICQTTMINILNHHCPGFLIDTNYKESVIFIIAMLMGGVIHIIIGNGQMIKIQIQMMNRRYDYMRLLSKLNWTIKEWEVAAETKQKIISLYTIIWHKRNGIVVKPSALNLLPEAFKKEIFVDIFWEALRHSHVFRELDVFVKKEISYLMQSDLLLPGDYLLKDGSMKSKMIYIVSGTVDLLSYEDDDSPILSFTSGTVLSEVCCFMIVPSKSNLRCATDCEIHTLDLLSVAKVLIKYRQYSHFLHGTIVDRIKYAKIYKKTQINRKLANRNSIVSSISRFKQHWRFVDKLHKLSRRKQTYSVRDIDLNFHSDFLDLYVIANTYITSISNTCLGNKMPLIIVPTSSFYQFLRYLHLSVVICQAASAPLFVIFYYQIPASCIALRIIWDELYFLNIYIQLTTAYKINNTIIFKFSKIVLHRFKSISFVIDLISAIPIDFFAKLLGAPPRQQELWRLLRAMQCYKLIEFIVELKTCFRISYIVVIFMKYIVIYFMTIYYFICIIFIVFCYDVDCTDTSASKESPWGHMKHPLLGTLYYSISVMMCMPVSTRTPITNKEMILYTLSTFIAINMYTFFLGETTASFIKMYELSYNYRDNLVMLNNFFRTNSVLAKVRQSMLDFYSFKWHNSKYFDIASNKIGYYQEDNLEQAIFLQRIAKFLKQMPVFATLSDNLLYKMATCCILRILPPGTTVCSTHKRSVHLHLIVRGYCQMKSLMPGDIEKDLNLILKSGDAFPVVEVLHNVNNVNSVTTITSVELIFIDYYEVRKIFMANPKEDKIMKRCLKWHLDKYRSILTETDVVTNVVGFIQLDRAKLAQVNLFRYYINDNLEKNIEIVGIGVLGYLLMKKTFDPLGKFFPYWETFRSFVAIIYASLHIGNETYLMDYQFITVTIIRIVEAIFVIDFYIRLHVQYYNAHGIAVTDTFQTAKNYLTTSFILDVIAAFPIHELKTFRFIHYTAVSTLLDTLFFTAILYRPICGLVYLENINKGTSHNFLKSVKFLVIGLTVVSLLATHILMIVCKVVDGNFICDHNENIISQSPFSKETNKANLFLIAIYAVVERFSRSFVGASEFEVTGDLNESVMHLVMPWLLRIVVVAGMTGIAIGGHVHMIDRRHTVHNFTSFVKKELVEESKVAEFVDYFDYIWKKNEGVSINTLLDSFPENHQLIIKVHLFETVLRTANVFEHLDAQSLRIFIRYMQIQYHQKDAAIVRCNDVQQTLFFVAKGEVEVTVANCKLASLKKGSMFGCFSKRGPTRQTITAVSKSNIELLAIDSNLFNQLLTLYPKCQAIMDYAIASSHEYIFNYDTERKSMAVISASYLSPFSSTLFGPRQAILKCLRHFMAIINSEAFNIYRYLFNVHFSPLGSIILVLLLFFDIDLNFHLTYIYTFDAFYIIDIVFSFHLYYIDTESGLRVKDPRLIRRRTAKSVGFWLDVISTIPGELIMLLTHKTNIMVRLATLNRVIRCYRIFVYYNNSKRSINMRTSLQWAYIIYLVSAELTVFSLIWYRLACNANCRYKESNGPTSKFIFTNSSTHCIVLSYVYTLNIFTSSGIRTVAPNTINQLIISISMSVLSVMTLSILCGAYTRLLIINGVSLNRHQNRTDRLKTYVQNHEISPILVKRIVYYMLVLWKRRRGELMPMLICEAPSYLQQDIMFAMYGHHFANHFLFKYAHVHFNRQLSVLLKVDLYAPNQLIVERGEYGIYFIHRGEVKRVTHSGYESLLLPGSSFGELQGLHKVAHTCTYTAHTIVDVLRLKRSDWNYLLNWFPATKEIIYSLLRVVDDTPVENAPSIASFNWE